MSKKTHDHAATELALALGLLVRRIRAEVPPESRDVSWAQMAVMRRLDTDGPATIADLARAERVKPQSMGATVAALEAMGIVERRPHPTDGRQQHIALTDKGTRLRRETRVAKQTWLAQAIARLDAADQQRLPLVTELITRLAESS